MCNDTQKKCNYCNEVYRAKSIKYVTMHKKSVTTLYRVVTLEKINSLMWYGLICVPVLYNYSHFTRSYTLHPSASASFITVRT